VIAAASAGVNGVVWRTGADEARTCLVTASSAATSSVVAASLGSVIIASSSSRSGREVASIAGLSER
jgi:hypothetical protein